VATHNALVEARAQLAAVAHVVRCEQCGAPATALYDTEGDGRYWLCDSKDDEHAEQYCGSQILRIDAGASLLAQLDAQKAEIEDLNERLTALQTACAEPRKQDTDEIAQLKEQLATANEDIEKAYQYFHRTNGDAPVVSTPPAQSDGARCRCACHTRVAELSHA
jgi:hypothetical protein